MQSSEFHEAREFVASLEKYHEYSFVEYLDDLYDKE